MTGPISFDSGINGIRSGLEGIQKTAGKIASKQSMQADSSLQLARSMVDLKVYEHQVNASVQVVKITDQVIGSLLDIKA
jgi:hypothetical protein